MRKMAGPAPGSRRIPLSGHTLPEPRELPIFLPHLDGACQAIYIVNAYSNLNP